MRTGRDLKKVEDRSKIYTTQTHPSLEHFRTTFARKFKMTGFGFSVRKLWEWGGGVATQDVRTKLAQPLPNVRSQQKQIFL